MLINKEDQTPDKSSVYPPASATSSPAQQLILCIHGTAAGDPSDVGKKWWQRGSDFCTSMNQRLEPHVRCGASDGYVFHWGDGPNSERERRQAGRELFEWLQNFEDKGHQYHVIAHSHGGSVVWHALIESVAAKRPLQSLRTWTTVATPFLRYRVDLRSLWFVLPFCVAVVAAIASFGRVNRLVQIWHSMATEGFLGSAISLVLVWFLISSIFLITLTQIVRVTYSWNHDRQLGVLSEVAWQTYGEKWLGVSAVEDEAINGLASTLGFRGDIMPRMSSWGNSPIARVANSLATPFRVVYNRLVAPIGDQFIWDRVARRLQGTDTAASRLDSVGRGPVPSARTPALPDKLNFELRDFANRELARTLATVRDVLGIQSAQPDLPDFVARVQRMLSWNELIHNSYFDVEGVCELLVQRIEEGTNIQKQLPGHKGENATQSATPVATRGGGSGMLLPATLACALTAITAGALLVLTAIYDNTVSTFSDEYQVVEAIASAPLAEAMADNYYHPLDQKSLSAWINGVMDAGFLKEAIDLARRHDAALGIVAAKLLALNRNDLFLDTINHQPSTTYDCRLAEAILILTRQNLTAKAQMILDILIQRQRAGVDRNAWCLGDFDGHTSNSPGDALDYSRYLLARAAARLGSPTSDVVQQTRAISDINWRQSAYIASMEEYLKRKEAMKAFAVYHSADGRIHFGEGALAALSDGLEKAGKAREAAEVADAAIAVLRKSDGYNASKNLVEKFVAAGAVSQAIRFLEKSQSSEMWKSAVHIFIASGNFDAAERAAKNLSDARWVFNSLTIAAVHKKDLTLARRYRSETGDDGHLIADDLLKAYFEVGAIDEGIEVARTHKVSLLELSDLVKKLTEKTHRLAAAKLLKDSLEFAPSKDRFRYLPYVIQAFAIDGKTQTLATLAKNLIVSAKEVLSQAQIQPLEYNGLFQSAIDTLVKSGFVDEAITLYRAAPPSSDAMEDTFNRDPQIIVTGLARDGRLDEAIQWCSVPRSLDSIRLVSCGIGERLLSRPMQSANLIASKLLKANLVEDAVIYLARSNMRAEVQEILVAMSRDSRDEAVNSILATYVDENDATGSLWAAGLISNVEERDSDLTRLSESFIDNGNGKAALAAVNAITDPVKRVSALLHYATGESQHDATEVLRALEEGLAVSAGIPAEGVRIQNQAEIATEIAKRGGYRRARLACITCPAVLKVKVYTALVDTYVKSTRQSKLN
jgi:hypothetical protein